MGLLDALGGRPGDTIRLKKAYDMYAQDRMSLGESPLDWGGWLDTQGYALGPDNIVIPKNLRAEDTGFRRVKY